MYLASIVLFEKILVEINKAEAENKGNALFTRENSRVCNIRI